MRLFTPATPCLAAAAALLATAAPAAAASLTPAGPTSSAPPAASAAAAPLAASGPGTAALLAPAAVAAAAPLAVSGPGTAALLAPAAVAGAASLAVSGPGTAVAPTPAGPAAAPLAPAAAAPLAPIALAAAPPAPAAPAASGPGTAVAPMPAALAAAPLAPAAAAPLAPIALAAAPPAPAAPAAPGPGTAAPPAPTAPAAAASPGSVAPLPACTAPDDHTFPLTTRIHGGPGAYETGGGYGVWYLDLTNTTSRTCEAVHPVVVLVDELRALRPAQARLEFFDGDHPRPVTFEETDRGELIGAFGEGQGDAAFPGFTVGPGRTLTVKVRLALTSDTAPGEVTANAAVVRRRGDDGDWVGKSNDYRFRIGTGGAPDEPADAPSGTRSAEPVAPSVASTPDGGDTGFPFADELAGTGMGRLDAALAAAALLLATGTAAVLLARGRR
ncbi:hypothetical protein [Streptomyces sp. NPDC127100]|uniref:hypothetical protein n=1 Tax=Streptomyces sp. NPDC127100 TaxID=3347138 RepID=UPI0036694857